MASILIVDDELDIRDLLAREFTALGHEIETAGLLSDALALGRAKVFDVVFLDVRLPDGNGLEALPELAGGPGSPEIIIMTAHGDPDGAELAVKWGAWDYLEKPISLDHFTLILQRTIRFRRQARAGKAPARLDIEGVIGESPPMKACLEVVAKAAPSHSNVLITGETGVGKELFAQLIHRNSPRASRPFIVVDCASLPENLLESILFGYEKGAFTGAAKSKSGLVRQADQGSLFLDEIGELPFIVQKRLLRLLQERRFRPVGAVRELEVDFRLLAATNRNLEKMVEQGSFRSDLLFRLKTFTIEIPPLRDRSDDIKALAIYFSNKLCHRFDMPEKGFSQDFFQVLAAYDWPGNVRELSNTMELVLADARTEPILFAKHLPLEIRAKSLKAAVAPRDEPVQPIPGPPLPGDAMDASDAFPTFKDYRDRGLAEIERDYLEMLIEKSRGDYKKALSLAGLARTRLYELLKKHDLSIKG